MTIDNSVISSSITAAQVLDCILAPALKLSLFIQMYYVYVAITYYYVLFSLFYPQSSFFGVVVVVVGGLVTIYHTFVYCCWKCRMLIPLIDTFPTVEL
jgi:hypothetical protein